MVALYKAIVLTFAYDHIGYCSRHYPNVTIVVLVCYNSYVFCIIFFDPFNSSRCICIFLTNISICYSNYLKKL
jgi:hypothetical protein